MKKLVLLLLAVLMCFSLCSCTALLEKAKEMATGTETSQPPADYIETLENEEYAYEVYETYIKITEYLGEETEVIIPSEIDSKPVTAIGSLCFFEKDVTSVTIPESVITIESSAFYYAESLISIEIPNTVKSIGTRAFGWCNALESVKISTSVTEIPDFCFNHCLSLTTVEIPESVTSIGVRAFSYCEHLSDITVSNNVKKVGDRAFAGCPLLEYASFINEKVILGKDVFAETENVVIIAPEGSSVYKYCENNSLRWSISKSIDAVQLTPPETSDMSDNSSDSSDNSEVSETSVAE